MNTYVVHIMHVVLYYIKLVKMTTYQLFKWIFINNLYQCLSSLKTFTPSNAKMQWIQADGMKFASNLHYDISEIIFIRHSLQASITSTHRHVHVQIVVLGSFLHYS